MPTVSVTGGADVKGVFLAYTGRDNAFRMARNLALQINQRYGSTAATYYNPASPPASPGSGLLIDTVASSASIDARGYGAVIDDTGVPESVLGGGSAGLKQIVLAAEGGLNFRAGSGNVTVVAGGGNNMIYFQPGDTGNNVAYTESGSNTIYGGDGNTTISAGSGTNAIFTRGGSSDVFVSGSDHITLGTGAVTVSVLAGGSAYVNGAGAVTVPASSYSLTFTGDTAAGGLSNTVYGGLGRVYIQAGSGGGLFRGGAEGSNSIYGGSGTVTIEGGGNYDTLIGGTGANDFIRAGIGNETLQGGSGQTTFGVYDDHKNQIAGSTDTIDDFKSTDIIRLIGTDLESAAAKYALTTYHITSAGGEFTLLDGTKVLLSGYTGALTHSNLK